MKKNNIVTDFLESKGIYNQLAKKAEQLIRELIQEDKIQIHIINSRVKEEDKLKEKLERKNYKYKSLEEITDLSGIRIITYFEDDVDRIAKIIEDEFEVDFENSIDKRKVESEKFGYMSLHYVVSYSKERLELRENKKFKDLKFEIQIRSILQHSWAEIEHDIGYKGELSIPQFAKRQFSRIAALLEIADIEFIRLRNDLKEYKSSLSHKIKIAKEEILIDKASLLELVKQDSNITEIENAVIEKFKMLSKQSLDEDMINFAVDNALSRLDKSLKNKIPTISQLQKLLEKHKSEVIEFAIKQREDDGAIVGNPLGLLKGAALSYLFDFLKYKN